jgi:hypothetical protein
MVSKFIARWPRKLSSSGTWNRPHAEQRSRVFQLENRHPI